MAEKKKQPYLDEEEATMDCLLEVIKMQLDRRRMDHEQKEKDTSGKKPDATGKLSAETNGESNLK